MKKITVGVLFLLVSFSCFADLKSRQIEALTQRENYLSREIVFCEKNIESLNEKSLEIEEEKNKLEIEKNQVIADKQALVLINISGN